MNIYKQLLNDIPELLDICNKLNVYTYLITFDTVNHINLGKVVQIITMSKTYNYNFKSSDEIILDDFFKSQYYNLKKILNNKKMQILNDELTDNNYNQYKTAIKSILQITVNPNSNYNKGIFDMFYFLYMTAYIDSKYSENEMLLFENKNILSKIIDKMCFIH